MVYIDVHTLGQWYNKNFSTFYNYTSINIDEYLYRCYNAFNSNAHGCVRDKEFRKNLLMEENGVELFDELRYYFEHEMLPNWFYKNLLKD